MSEALVKVEPNLEITHNGHGTPRTIARGSQGKFVKKHTVAVRHSMKNAIDFLQTNADGKDKSRAAEMYEKIYEAVLKGGQEELVGMTKALEFLEKAAFGSKGKDREIEKSDESNTQIKMVLVQPLCLGESELKKRLIAAETELDRVRKAPRKPSWIEAEVVSTNEPSK